MKMSAGKSEAASIASALGNPHQGLRRSFRDGVARRGIAFVRAIGAAHRGRGRHGRENRSDALHGLAKAEMKIPFVVRRKRFHTARHRMPGKLLELRLPV